MKDVPETTIKPEPHPVRCNICDFGSGQRGMDRCSTCDGTGSMFVVNGRRFPNTEEGFNKALEAQNNGNG
jgi:hypothetical protein